VGPPTCILQQAMPSSSVIIRLSLPRHGRDAALSNNPPQHPRLVIGEPPCTGEEFCPRDWILLLILKIVEPCHELGTVIWLAIHHPEASAPHRDDDVSIPSFHVEVACAHRCCLVSSHAREIELPLHEPNAQAHDQHPEQGGVHRVVVSMNRLACATALGAQLGVGGGPQRLDGARPQFERCHRARRFLLSAST
jgi:hypothetical protein